VRERETDRQRKTNINTEKVRGGESNRYKLLKIERERERDDRGREVKRKRVT
jgi:hypothetical protein